VRSYELVNPTFKIWLCGFKTKKKRNFKNMCPLSISGMPSSQALPSFLSTAPPSVCVPDVIGALAVWIQNQNQKIKIHICMYIHTKIKNEKIKIKMNK